LILELIEEVKSTLPPAQNVVGPLAVTIGAGGIGFTVIVIDVLGLVHPNNVCARVYVPANPTVILCVVADVDQIFPVEADEVNMIVLPSQNVVGPLGVIVGVGGIGFTVIEVEALAGLVHPFKSVT
jgi:hypothetical protein